VSVDDLQWVAIILTNLGVLGLAVRVGRKS
jgi:hypothetical protein